jgi:hypothetical protein
MIFPIRSRAVLAAGFVASAVFGAQAGAQATSDSARGSIRVRVAAGTDLGIGDSYLAGGSALGVLGLEWRHRRAPFSARLDLSYFRRADDYGEQVAQWCTGYCVFADRQERLGLSIDGRYTFLSRAPIRPYLLSGFGLYATKHTITSNATCRDFRCTVEPDGRDTRAERSVGLGLHAGIGLAVPFRTSELSLELRVLQMSSGWRNPYTLPVILGIRF